MYQVGSLVYLKDDDPLFADYEEAVTHAIEQSIDDSIYGLWEKESGYLEAIIYGCEVFER